MIPFQEAKETGNELLDRLDTPFYLAVACDLNGSTFYTSTFKATTEEMSIFVLGLLEQMIDNQAVDDEIIESVSLMREYIKKHGGFIRPVSKTDFLKSEEEENETG